MLWTIPDITIVAHSVSMHETFSITIPYVTILPSLAQGLVVTASVLFLVWWLSSSWRQHEKYVPYNVEMPEQCHAGWQGQDMTQTKLKVRSAFGHATSCALGLIFFSWLDQVRSNVTARLVASF